MSMLLDSLLRSSIDPALSLLPPKMTSDDARAMLLTITLQEAEGINRIQFGDGPAHGLWQMEEGGGVRGVMTHPSSRDFARTVCYSRKLPFDQHAVWNALAHDDVLAGAFARLLLWTDLRPMPGINAPDDETWAYYERNWRPGKPRPKDWPKNRQMAVGQVIA